MATSRRIFCTQAATLLLTPRLLVSQTPNPRARPDVAAIDHDRILEAAAALPISNPQLHSPHFPARAAPVRPHDFYSEAEDYWPDPSNPGGPYVIHTSGPSNPDAFTAHRDALLDFSICVPALTAAFVLTNDDTLRPASRRPSASLVHRSRNSHDSEPSLWPDHPAREDRPLRRRRRSRAPRRSRSVLPFLTNSEALTEPDYAALKKWFAEYFDWLNSSRLAGLARDNKSHHGTSWLLQAAAIAHLSQVTMTRPLPRFVISSSRVPFARRSSPMARFRANSLRQTLTAIRSSISTCLPRICVLLSTRFESVWDYELQDGPGMRTVIARTLSLHSQPRHVALSG